MTGRFWPFGDDNHEGKTYDEKTKNNYLEG